MTDLNLPIWTRLFLFVLLLFGGFVIGHLYFNHRQTIDYHENVHTIKHWIEIQNHLSEISHIALKTGNKIHQYRKKPDPNLAHQLVRHYQQIKAEFTKLKNVTYEIENESHKEKAIHNHTDANFNNKFDRVINSIKSIQEQIDNLAPYYKNPIQNINKIETALEKAAAHSARLNHWINNESEEALIKQINDNYTIEKQQQLIAAILLCILVLLGFYGSRITNRIKRVNAELFESEQRFEMAQRSASFGVWDWDIKKNFLLWDEMMFQIFQVNPTEFKNDFDSWKNAVIAEDAEASTQLISTILSDKNTSKYMDYFRIKAKNGQIRYIRADAIILRDKHGNAFRMVGLNYDITDIKELENDLRSHRDNLVELVNEQTADLQEAKNRAEMANEAKSQFLSNMTHELRTPLNGLIGILQIFKQMPLPDEQRELVSVMDSSSSILLRLINDILDFAKIEANEITFEKIGFDLISTIGKAVIGLQSLALKKSIYLQTEFPEKPLPLVIGDPLRVQQIINNLLSNAIKYTNNGGITVQVTARQSTERYLEITCRITDTGIGIPEEKLETIFKKFSQVDDSTTRRYGGTGLGLAIAKELTEKMGGTIHVSSTVDKGSSFWFVLSFPITHELHHDYQATTLAPSLETHDKLSYKQVSILVAEDHPLNQLLIRKLLERIELNNYIIVENGALALEAMKTQSFSLVLMDCYMPEMSGYDATKYYREWEKRHCPESRLPIIATTANAMQGDSQKCFESGMDAYIAKPIIELELHRTLSEWIILPETLHYDDKNKNYKEESSTTPPVDLSILRSYSQGDEDFEHLSIAVFLEQSDINLRDLQREITCKEPKKWIEAAHRFKGAAGGIGAEKLRHLCAVAQTENYKTQSIRETMFKQITLEFEAIDTYFQSAGYHRRGH